MHASNTARFEQSVRDVADQLKIQGRKDSKADLLQLLRNWLRDETKGRWLIVLDNADDVEFLRERPAESDAVQLAQRQIDYFPVCDHGCIMFTTRSKSEALKLVYETDIIIVRPMSEEEAAALFDSKLEKANPEHRELALALDCMPLAIMQAAAYIRERTPRCSVQQYREDGAEPGIADEPSPARCALPGPGRRS
jgi:hypothetical protein